MASLSVLHISDLHFADESNIFHPLIPGHNEAVANALAEFAQRRQSEFSRIIITGDLARTGLREDLRAARRFLFGPPHQGFQTLEREPTLQAANCKIHLMPGNHDRFHDESGNPNCREFEMEFGSEWSESRRGIQVVEIPVEGSNYCAALVFADCCLRDALDANPPGRFHIWGQGRVYDDIAEGLEEETAKLQARRDAHRVIVWVLHFPPTDDDIEEALQLVNHGEIRVRALRRGIPLMWCGHIHKMRSIPPGNDQMTIWSAGQATAVSPFFFRKLPHTAHIIKIECDAFGPGTVRMHRRNFIFANVNSSGGRYREVARSRTISWTLR